MLSLHSRHVLDDPGVYTASALLWNLENSLSVFLIDSGTLEVLVRRVRYLYVGVTNSPKCDPNHPNSDWQLGVHHQSRLRVECYPRTASLPVDDMGA
jgi:hypothetical protein